MAWDDLEQPALRWVFTHPREQTDWLGNESHEPASVLPELTQAQLNEALHRLYQHGFTTGPGPAEGAGVTDWMNMRVTADGLRALGEWPYDPRMTLTSLLSELLEDLARQGSAEEGGRLKRAGGAVLRFGEDVLRGELRHLGEEIGS
jgi:hypothetical protein